MSDEIVFDVLCTKVLDALRALGLGKFSIRNYYYEGMWPIIKVYRSEGVILYSAAFTNEIVDRFRLEHENGLVADRIWAKVRKAAALFEEYVQTGKIVWKRVRPAPKIPLTPYYQELLCSFCQHEANTRAIGFESLRDEENICRKFFAYLDDNDCHTCQDINLGNVNAFLVFIASHRKSSMDRVGNTLKHLSAYLVSTKSCRDFSAALITRPAPRKKLRPAFSSKEVRMVMDTAAKNPTLSLRDTAMFAVAASLGLRAGDIVRLTLSDIDWIHHEIHFVQNKTGVELHLPLEASVGNAIANYILHERPKTQSRALFIRSRIPFDAITSTAAGDRLRKYMKLSDVEYTPGDGKGFHSFRISQQKNDGQSYSLGITQSSGLDRHAVYSMTTGSFTQVSKEKAPTVLARDYKDPTAVCYGIGRDTFNQGQNAKFAPTFEEELQPTLVAKGPGAIQSGYTVRRLTPTECARLQGFPDNWCADLGTEKPTDEEMYFWHKVFKTYSEVTGCKMKSDKQVAKWLKDPYSDSAEYKMWGNGVALPCVWFVLCGIVWYAQSGGDNALI